MPTEGALPSVSMSKAATREAWRDIHTCISRLRKLEGMDEQCTFTSLAANARFPRFTIRDSAALLEFFTEYEKDRSSGLSSFAETAPKHEESMLVMDYDCKAPSEDNIARSLIEEDFIFSFVARVQAYLSKNVRSCFSDDKGGKVMCTPDCVILRKPPYVLDGFVKHGFHLQFPKVFLPLEQKGRIHRDFPELDASWRNPWLLYGSSKRRRGLTYGIDCVLIPAEYPAGLVPSSISRSVSSGISRRDRGPRRIGFEEYFSSMYEVTDTRLRYLFSESEVQLHVAKFLCIRNLGCEFSRSHYRCFLERDEAGSLATAEESFARPPCGCGIDQGVSKRPRLVQNRDPCGGFGRVPPRKDGGDESSDGTDEETWAEPGEEPGGETEDGTARGVGEKHERVPIHSIQKRLEATYASSFKVPRNAAHLLLVEGHGHGFVHMRRLRASPCPLDSSHVHHGRPVFFKVFRSLPGAPVYVGCSCGRVSSRRARLVNTGITTVTTSPGPNADAASYRAFRLA